MMCRKFFYALASSVGLYAHARGGAQGGGYRGKYRDDEVQDFLDDFFFHSGLGFRIVDDLFGFPS